MTDLSKPRLVDEQWGEATKLVQGGTIRSPFGETSEALFLTSGYVYNTAEEAEARFKGEDEGYIYSRFSNPTVSMFEERMKALEGAEAARATGTGMAAVTASLLCQLNAGDHIVSSRALFGSCRYVVETLAPRFGIESTLVDGRDLDAWQNAIRPNTKVFFFESPANPTTEVVDIEAVCEIAHANGARVVIDNVFATPILQKPLQLGADVVVYSATKHIDGQGRCLGGIVLSNEDFVSEFLHDFMRQTGPSISPFNAWVMLKGLETLALRVDRHVRSAEMLAEFLNNRKEIRTVLYPGSENHPQADICRKQMKAGGNVIAFELKGNKETVFNFLNALKIIRISNNLGDTKSLVTHPATTTHQRLTPDARAELGISDSLVRVSVGLEDVADLTVDIDQALAMTQQ
ncbi:MAG: O-succinylhomoserine sulfhydrylase [Methyloligellaceae bacterium]